MALRIFSEGKEVYDAFQEDPLEGFEEAKEFAQNIVDVFTGSTPKRKRKTIQSNPRPRKFSKHSPPRRQGSLSVRPDANAARRIARRLRPRSLFRPRRARPQRRQALPRPAGAPPANNVLQRAIAGNMPRRARYRRGGRFRRARKRYARRSSKFRKFRRRSRRARKRPSRRLRLYPAGYPRTHKVKLRCMKQVAITVRPNEWGYVEFRMNSMNNPLFDQGATAAVGPHQKLRFTDKHDVVIVSPNLPQPYGFDGWLDQTILSSNMYQRYKVLGSKLTLTATPGDIQATGTQWVGGFSGLHSGLSSQGTTWAQQYATVDRSEVADVFNTGLIKKPQLLSSIATHKRLGPTFVRSYSHRKWQKQMLRTQGQADNEDWFGTHATAPTISCKANFIIADLAATSAAAIVHFMFEQEYTIQLSGALIALESAV